MKMTEVFDKQKEQSLKGIDHSKKGSFDVPIHDLIVLINTQQDFFTTSSCSGRILVFCQVCHASFTGYEFKSLHYLINT